ncbi:hypothetical protein LC586_31700 [Nostoc sp. CHAB 5714]|uniref:Uncharacterized protein n=1 Tax=Nostoc favosum CHAB5714 TaxID=2780399 RepID=A0ABS8IH87_9NOSO|nr:hypothetical protein [Nostoc favosum CHAB5714]
MSDRWRDRITQGRLSSNLGNKSSIWRQLIEELWLLDTCIIQYKLIYLSQIS